MMFDHQQGIEKFAVDLGKVGDNLLANSNSNPASSECLIPI